MDKNKSDFINTYDDVYNAIGQIHEQKRNNFKNILGEIREKFNHLLNNESLDVTELNELLEINKGGIPPQTIYYDCVSTLSAIQNADHSRDEKRFSQMSFKTESSNKTYYLDEKKNPQIQNKSNRPLMLVEEENAANQPFNENKENSFLKHSICTNDLNCPLGTSTPTSPDYEVDTPAPPNNSQEFSRNISRDYNLRLKSQVLKSNNTALRDKNVNTNFPNTRLEATRKKKVVELNATTTANKRKREERIQKITAKREVPQRIKRQVIVKSEKEKAEKNKIIQKKKDDKPVSKNTPKMPRPTLKKYPDPYNKKKTQINTPSTSQNEVLEYNIDHVVDSCSSDEEGAPKNKIPQWATKEMREHPLIIQSWLNKSETVIPWFFSERLKQPSLEELFSMKMQLRPRTSSAVWL